MGVKKRKGASKSNGRWTGGTFEDAVKIYVGTVEVQKIFKGRGRLLEDFTASPASPGDPSSPSPSPSPSPTPASVPGGIDTAFLVGGFNNYQNALSYSYPSSTWATEATVPATFYCLGSALGNKSGTNYTAHCCHLIYNGASWSTGTNHSCCRRYHAGGGTPNAGIWFAGRSGPSISCSGETWDGSSFSSIPNSPGYGNGCLTGSGGTVNSFFSFGGHNGGNYSGYYDGTSWAAKTKSPQSYRTRGFGTINSAVDFFCCSCGTSSATTSEWNGSAWSTGVLVPNNSYSGGAGSSASEGMTVGHSCSSLYKRTLEYTSPTYSTGGNLPSPGGYYMSVTT